LGGLGAFPFPTLGFGQLCSLALTPFGNSLGLFGALSVLLFSVSPLDCLPFPSGGLSCLDLGGLSHATLSLGPLRSLLFPSGGLS
jgi:hypothetical protein